MKPLTDAELDELEAFLESDALAGRSMTVSALHGMLTAVVINPGKSIPPSQWLPVALGTLPGAEHDWTSTDELHHVLSLMLRINNEIVYELQNDPDAFEPMWLEGKVGRTTYRFAEEWAFGFVEGTTFFQQDMLALEGTDMERFMQPFFQLVAALIAANETDTNLNKGIKARQKIVDQLPGAVIALYRYFLPIRLARLEVELASESTQHKLNRAQRRHPGRSPHRRH